MSTNPKHPAPCLDYFSIVIIGDSNVGKTSILNKYCNNSFSFSKKKHKTIDTFKKTITLGNKEFSLKLWDTHFQESDFESNKQIYERADCLVFVCSYDIKDSLLNLSKWYQQYNDNVDISNKQMMIFVNKNDLDDDEREFNSDDVKEKSKEMGIKMVEVSSLEGDGIEEAFNGIIKTLVEKMYEGGDNKTKEGDNEGEVHSSCVVV